MRRPYRKPPPPDPLGNHTETIADRVREAIEKRPGEPTRIPEKKTTRYNPAVHPLVVTYLKRDGADDEEICRVLGITRRTLGVWVDIHRDMADAVNTNALGVCESVTRALYASAVGREVTDVERVYEMRVNPVTRKKERVLAREKEIRKTILPNPLSCFFYLQNRDASRWQPAGGRTGQASPFTPEQVSAMLRTSASALSDATIGVVAIDATS
jgi:hypothetical protein